MIPPVYILLLSAAAFVQGTVGFAFALLTVPLLTLVIAPGAATALGATLGTVVVVTGVIMHREEIEWRGMLALTAAAVVFLPVGALFVARAPEAVVLSILGLIALAVGVDSLLRLTRSRRRATETEAPQAAGSLEQNERLRPPQHSHSHTATAAGAAVQRKPRHRLLGVFAAAIAGILGGAFATPGPPMVAYLYATTPDRRLAKANLQAFFIVTSVLTVVTQAAVGNLTAELLPFALLVTPPVAASTAFGVHISRRLDILRLRIATDLALVGLGLALIYGALGH